MNTLFPHNLSRLLIAYLITSMACSAPATADALARALSCATALSLDLLAAGNAFTPGAYANKAKETRRVQFRQSKPAMWVNYADPRPKGDDADNGAQPSYLPQVAVNNVSLNAAVSHALFAVNIPLGPVSLSPTLTYTPPTITRSADINNPAAISCSFAADAGAFGNCWSDNLTPVVERNASRATILDVPCYETSLNVNGGTTPSASFKGQNLPVNQQINFANVNWTCQPLSKASVINPAQVVQFWGSGLTINETNAFYSEYEEMRSGCRNSYTRWQWPLSIFDRNGNACLFSYGDAKEAVGSFSWNNSSGWDMNTTMLRVPTCISNVASADAILLAADMFSQDISTSTNVVKYTATVTNLVHQCAGQPLRAAQFTYQSWSLITNAVCSYTLRLLSSVRLPNGDLVSNVYAAATLDPALTGITVPLLTKIITPAGVTLIEYSSLNAVCYESSKTWKYEPNWVRVITDSGLTTNFYERTSYGYDCTTGAGWAEMRTVTAAETTNAVRYNLFYQPLNMQWYGCQTENTLDNTKQNAYSLDARFRYTSATRYPLGDPGPSDISRFGYDDRDNLTNVVDADSNVTRYFYAPNKLDQTCVIDRRGVVSSNIYDARGNLLITYQDYGSGKLNRMSSNVYNRAGQVIKSFDPLGRVTRNFYSLNRTAGQISSYNGEPQVGDVGFLVATRDALDRVSTYSYDTFGRKIVENTPGNTDAARYVVTSTFDIMDRLTSTMYPDGTYISNVYNAAGYPVRARDRMARETTNTWDAAGHLVHVLYANGDWVKKEYTGNLVSKLMDAAGNTTQYFYCHEQLTGVCFPDGSTRAAGFDNLNRQVWAIDERGVAVTNAYDKLDRLIASAYVPFSPSLDLPPDVTAVASTLSLATCNTAAIYGGFANQLIRSTYDQVGNLISMTDWAGTITNAYDALNRCVLEHTQYSGTPSLEYSLSFGYDLLDNRLGMTLETPQNTLINGYSYDALNRLAALTHNGLKQISVTNIYNPNGKLALVSATESGATRSARTFSYDSEQRLSAINGSYSGVEKLALTYAYNNAQQITTLGESIEGESQTYTFAYDQRDQLTNETVSGATTVYGYDQAQNRVMKKAGAATPDAYGFTFANKLTNIHVGAQNANNRYWYDTAGNLVTSVVNAVTNCYWYNAQNKLACVMLYRVPSEKTVHVFSYDSLNRRVSVSKTIYMWPVTYSVTRCVLHDGNLPLAEAENGDVLTRAFVRSVGLAEGTGDVIAEIIGTDSGNAKAVFYLSNHRGDTLGAYRDSSTLVAKYRYDAFGNQRTAYCMVNEPENAPRYTFSTKEFLSDAQLYLYAYRVYDPVAGRWTQRDPIDYQDSLNLYQFCGNNPVNITDADGRIAGLLIGALAGGIVGGSISALKGEGFGRGFVKGAIVGAVVGGLADGSGALLAGAALVAGAAVEAGDLALKGELNKPGAAFRVAGAGIGAAVGAGVGSAVGGAMGEAMGMGISQSLASQTGQQLGTAVGGSILAVPASEGAGVYCGAMAESMDAAYRIADDIKHSTKEIRTDE